MAIETAKIIKPQIVTPKGRFNYVFLSKIDDRKNPNYPHIDPTYAYKLTFIIKNGDWTGDKGKQFRKEILDYVREELGEPKLTLKGLSEHYLMPWKDGNEPKENGEPREDCFKDTVFFNSKTISKPKSEELGFGDPKPRIFGPSGDEMDEEEIETIKAGDYGRLIISPRLWKTKLGQGLSLDLRAVQFGRVGKALGGGVERQVALLRTEELDMDFDDIEIDD